MTASIGERIEAAAWTLAPVSESPRTDAEILLAHALGVPRSRLLASLHTSLDEWSDPSDKSDKSDRSDTHSRRRLDTPQFDALIERRLAHEPVAYILGEWEFFSMPLAVTAPMLVPRPETEHLVEAVLEHIGRRPARVLEIGVGTGCVSLAIANHAPKATIVATDINPAALDLATRNAEAYGLDGRIEFRQGDLFDVHPALARDFDVICSNPPYVEDEAWPGLSETIRRYEDPRALLAGADGLDVIRRLVNEALDYLVSGGLLAFEMGQGQSARVLGLLDGAGYVGVDVRNDLAGIPRIATARKPCP